MKRLCHDVLHSDLSVFSTHEYSLAYILTLQPHVAQGISCNPFTQYLTLYRILSIINPYLMWCKSGDWLDSPARWNGDLGLWFMRFKSFLCEGDCDCRISSIIIFRIKYKAMKSQVLHAVLCNIPWGGCRGNLEVKCHLMTDAVLHTFCFVSTRICISNMNSVRHEPLEHGRECTRALSAEVSSVLFRCLWGEEGAV